MTSAITLFDSHYTIRTPSDFTKMKYVCCFNSKILLLLSWAHLSQPKTYSSVHGSPAFVHLHRVHFAFDEQWHLINSEQALAASERGVHKGCHLPSNFSQPQTLGNGNYMLHLKLLPICLFGLLPSLCAVHLALEEGFPGSGSSYKTTLHVFHSLTQERWLCRKELP